MTSIDPERFGLHLAAERERLGSMQLALPGVDQLMQSERKVRALGVGQSVRHAGHRISRTEDGYHVTGPSGQQSHPDAGGAVRQVLRHQMHQMQDQSTKDQARFVTKLASSRPAEQDAHIDVQHPSGKGTVRLFGDGRQMAMDSKGHASYHETLESAAHAAGQDNAFAKRRSYTDEGYGGPGTLLSAIGTTFDWRMYRLHLSSVALDPEDAEEGGPQDILEDTLEDLQQRLAKLRVAGNVAPEVLKAAELAVQDAQQRLDHYKATGQLGESMVNQDV